VALNSATSSAGWMPIVSRSACSVCSSASATGTARRAQGQAAIGAHLQVAPAAHEVAGVARLHRPQSQQLLPVAGQQHRQLAEVTIGQAFAHDHQAVDPAVGLAVGGAGVERRLHATTPGRAPLARIGWLN
jgi:hypothetical protein